MKVGGLFTLWLATLAMTVSTPAAEGGAKRVRVQVEFIDVSQMQMTDLLRDRKDQDDGNLRDELQKMIKAGEARLVETQLAVGRFGQKATTESNEEFISD